MTTQHILTGRKLPGIWRGFGDLWQSFRDLAEFGEIWQGFDGIWQGFGREFGDLAGGI